MLGRDGHGIDKGQAWHLMVELDELKLQLAGVHTCRLRIIWTATSRLISEGLAIRHEAREDGPLVETALQFRTYLY